MQNGCCLPPGAYSGPWSARQAGNAGPDSFEASIQMVFNIGRGRGLASTCRDRQKPDNACQRRRASGGSPSLKQLTVTDPRADLSREAGTWRAGCQCEPGGAVDGVYR